MCIAIVTKPGARITRTQAANSWSNNDDGAGFAYVADGKVEVRRGFMTFDEFWAAYDAAAQEFGETSHFLVHFRIGTSGGNTPENTHPFTCQNFALIHNGVFFSPPYSSERSDTRILAEDPRFSALTKEQVVAGLQKLSSYIVGNKVAFLFPDNTVAIANEKSGDWVDNCWFSNKSHSYCTTRGDYSWGGHGQRGVGSY